MPIALVFLAMLACDDPPPRSIVITTDCGVEVDDQWAIAHLALSPEFELKGIVTTHAPLLEAPAAETAARAARRLLERIGDRGKTTVVAGSSVPLIDEKTPRIGRGTNFLLEQSRGFTKDRRLIVLVLGAATDAASALLIDPSWGDRVRIAAMGFNDRVKGGDVFNVRNDPAAWRVLLRSRAPLVVGDARVTSRFLKMTREQARASIGRRGRAGYGLAESLVDWLDRHPALALESGGDRDAWPIWDEVTVAYLLGLTRSETRPRPTLSPDLSFDPSRPGEGTIDWIVEIDSERLWADFDRRLKNAERRDR